MAGKESHMKDEKSKSEEIQNIEDGETSTGERIPEYYFSNPDPYHKTQPVPPERRNHNYKIDDDGTITVKNPSAWWIPEVEFKMEASDTEYTVTGSYEGKETLDERWRRILAKWPENRKGGESEHDEDSHDGE